MVPTRNRTALMRAVAIAAIMVLASVQIVMAATISMDGDIVHVAGPIAEGDSQKVLDLLRASTQPGAGHTLDVDSTGGDMKEATDLALIVAANDVPVRVSFGSVCYSACFTLLAAASRRVIFSPARVGVHSLGYADGRDAGDATNAALALYRRLGVQDSILLKIENTNKSDITLLTDEEIMSLGYTDYNTVTRQSVAADVLLGHYTGSPPVFKNGKLKRESVILLAKMPPLGSQAFWEWFDRERSVHR